MPRVKFPLFSCFGGPRIGSDEPVVGGAVDTLGSRAAGRAQRPGAFLRNALQRPELARRELSQDFAELRRDLTAFIDEFARLEEAVGILEHTAGAADLAALLREAHAPPQPAAAASMEAVAPMIHGASLARVRELMTLLPEAVDALSSAFFEQARVAAPAAAQAGWWRRGPAVEITPRDHVHTQAEHLRGTLPPALQHAFDTALMHYDREALGVTYTNDSTLVMEEPLASVPRAHFLATADGYAWDVRELAETISITQRGAMKNPVSGEYFAESDIAALLRHPDGQRLRLQADRVQELRAGMRTEAARRLKSLGETMQADPGNNDLQASRSQQALAAFRAYVLTLPSPERAALYELPVHGRDTHTGAVFNGDSVRQVLDDAQSGHDCFHKAGDKLRQTAERVLAEKRSHV